MNLLITPGNKKGKGVVHRAQFAYILNRQNHGYGPPHIELDGENMDIGLFNTKFE